MRALSILIALNLTSCVSVSFSIGWKEIMAKIPIYNAKPTKKDLDRNVKDSEGTSSLAKESSS